MKKFFRKYYSIGDGASGYTEPNAKAAGFLNAANNGLSLSTISPNTAVLGQNIGQAGDPAALLNSREIPLGNAGNFLQLRLNASDFLQLLRSQILIGASNAGGATALIGLANIDDGDQLLISIDNAGIHFQFGGGVFMNWTALGGFIWSGPEPSAKHDFQGGFGGPIPTLVAPTVPTTDPPGAGVIIDTSASVANVVLDPVAMVDRLYWIKKKGTDVNAITITPSSGQIFANAGGAASYTFGGPGESTLIGSDGTNLFVL